MIACEKTKVSSVNMERGFSLIEMMIAIAIGIILSIGLIQVMVAGKTAAQATQGANFMQENARFAVSQLSYSLQMADHWGPSNPDKGNTTAAAQTLFNTIVASCPGLLSTSGNTYVTGQNWWTLGTFGLSGSLGDPNSVLGAGCLPDWDNGSESDTIVVRYADSNFIHCTDVACAAPDPSTPVVPGALYVRTAVGKDMVLATGAEITNLASQTYATPLDAGYFESPDHANQDGLYTFPYRIEIYYVRKCSTPIGGSCTGATVDNGSPIKTLWRRRLGDDGTFALEPVVEGIEHMTLEYGLASDDVSSGVIPVRFSDIQTYDPASTVGTLASGTLYNWLKVVSVRVGLLAQSDSLNSSGTRGNIGQKNLQGGRNIGSDNSPGARYTPGDPLLQYAVFSTSGQVRNRDRG